MAVNILPKLPREDIIQMIIFLYLFTISSFAMVGNWLGISFSLNNGTLLIISFFVNLFSENVKVYFLFAYTLFISSIIDILSIGFNWKTYYGFIPGYSFFISFVLTIILIITKVIIGLYELQKGKEKNNEEPLPIDFNFINKVSNTNRKKNANDNSNSNNSNNANKRKGKDVEANDEQPYYQQSQQQPSAPSYKREERVEREDADKL